MIHLSIPTVSPVVNIAFAWHLFCFEKWGRMDGCTDGQHVQKQWSLLAVTVGQPRGSTRHVSPMIPMARCTVLTVAITIFTWYLFCFEIFWKVRMNGQTTCVKIVITTSRGCVLAQWINKIWNKEISTCIYKIFHQKTFTDTIYTFCLSNLYPIFQILVFQILPKSDRDGSCFFLSPTNQQTKRYVWLFFWFA